MRFKIFPLEERIVLDAAAAGDIINISKESTPTDAAVQTTDINALIDALTKHIAIAADAAQTDTAEKGVHVLVVSADIPEVDKLVAAVKEQVIVVVYNP